MANKTLTQVHCFWEHGYLIFVWDVDHQYGSLSSASVKSLPNFLRLFWKEQILKTCITQDCSEEKVKNAEKYILEVIYRPNVRARKSVQTTSIF